ncbi:hypothetical protein SS50377_28248 [Spironucleus salmonicida]|uniref:Uncharacterized protein n=1 Tax=Spironucleus salmonicida TaxID=348837 RepID=A0A9P8LLC9_9EUKA|nr:hypothetical protein SS50377_28248 [Spironucleus salmonicida]
MLLTISVNAEGMINRIVSEIDALATKRCNKRSAQIENNENYKHSSKDYESDQNIENIAGAKVADPSYCVILLSKINSYNYESTKLRIE